MERIPVDSSTIRSVGYDPDNQVLEMEFKTGNVYEYTDVPVAVFQDLLEASSRGQFFNAHIRNNYPYEKICC